MPKRTAAVLTAVLMLTLTGCAVAPESEQIAPQAPTESSAAETPEPTASDEPDDLEPVESAPVEVTPLEMPDPQSKQALQSQWYGVIGKTLQLADYPYPLIDDVLPAGQYICDQYRLGVLPEEIKAFSGLREEDASVNEWIVQYTVMDPNYNWAPPAEGEQHPQFCAVLFPPA